MSQQARANPDQAPVHDAFVGSGARFSRNDIPLFVVERRSLGGYLLTNLATKSKIASATAQEMADYIDRTYPGENVYWNV